MAIPLPPVLTINEIANRWTSEIDGSFLDIVSVIIRAVGKVTIDEHSPPDLFPWRTEWLDQNGEFKIERLEKYPLSTLPLTDYIQNLFNHPLHGSEQEIRTALHYLCFNRGAFLTLIEQHGECTMPQFWGPLISPIEEMIKNGRSTGKSQKEIAIEIDAHYTGKQHVSDTKLGFWLPAKWQNYRINQIEAAKKQGKRLRGNAK